MEQKQIEVKPDGNDFQYKVKNFLSENGWSVRMSPYYNDAFSEKPREIDIIAEKAFLQTERSIYTGTVIVRLFIECKYVTEQTIFWLENKDIEKTKEVVETTQAFHHPNENYDVLKTHHYLSSNLVAKLYRTEGQNRDGDPVYKAMTQCLNATIYYRYRNTDLKKQYDHQTVTELNYPVIVCNSFEKFLTKNTTTNSTINQVTEPFLLEVDYAYTSKDKQLEEMFYIDILSINKIKDFEDKILLKEVNLAKQKISDDAREDEFNRRKSGRDDFNQQNDFW